MNNVFGYLTLGTCITFLAMAAFVSEWISHHFLGMIFPAIIAFCGFFFCYSLYKLLKE